MSTPSPDFLKFIGYLGLPLNASNLAFYTDLFVNFTQFYSEPDDSLEIKFIKWKRFYDASSFPLQILPEFNCTNTVMDTDNSPHSTVNVSPQAEHQPCDHQVYPPHHVSPQAEH
jgi:hypothetical protein